LVQRLIEMRYIKFWHTWMETIHSDLAFIQETSIEQLAVYRDFASIRVFEILAMVPSFS